jgi:hypothetical protein
MPSSGASTPPFISKGGDVTRMVTESVTIWSQLGLYLYLPILHIFFRDIIIYALGSMPYLESFGWWTESQRTLLGPSESMWGGTLGTNPRQQPRVLDKWVGARSSGSSLCVTNLPSTQFQELSTLVWNWWVLFHRIDRIRAPYRCTY